MPYIHKTPAWLKYLYPSLTWDRSEHPDKVIYLTFDDGPIPEVTEFVLDTLDHFEAKATFFCVGENIEKHQSVASAVLERGHLIGNHTHNHIKGWNTSNEKYADNIRLCDAAIEGLGISNNNYFRPPYGRIGPGQIKMIKSDYEIVMWDVLTGDYNSALSANAIFKSVTKVTQPGSIVLFHDSIKAYPRMKEVLPDYLSYFSERGYTFKTL